MTHVFRNAGVKNASGHRLRARFISLLVEALLDDAEQRGRMDADETILLIAAEAAGQKNTKSLRPYLDLARRKAFRRRNGHVENAASPDSKLKQTLAIHLESLRFAVEKGDRATMGKLIDILTGLLI
jgi:hypothetical protein